MSPASAPNPGLPIGNTAATASGAPLVRVEHLSKEFPAGSTGIIGGKKLSIKAVTGVHLEIAPGETLGLVGESGSGKSTLGRLILRLLEPTSGTIRFEDRDLLGASPGEMRRLRRDMQIIFQDPFASLDPRFRVEDIIAEPLLIHREAGAQPLSRSLRQGGLQGRVVEL